MKTIKTKQTSIPWLGEIPESWEVRKMKFIGKFSASGIDKKEKEDEIWVSMINYTDVYGNKKMVLNSGFDYMKTTCSEQKSIDHKVRKGDLIFTPSSETIEDIGVSALVDEDLDNTVYSYHVLRFRFNTEMEHNFKKYLCNNNYTYNYYSSSAQGTTRQTLSRDDFNETLVFIPPLQTQKKIADYLDNKTEKIKKLVEDKKKMIELLKEQMLALATIEQHEGKGSLVRIAHLVTLIKREVKIDDSEEYVALGLYNRGRGLFHKPSKKGVDMGDSNFFYVKEGDLILSGQFAWEGAVTIADSTEDNCVVSHRYPILRGKEIETEYLLVLLMTNFGDFLLNESSIGSAGRNRPLNINLLLSKKIRIPDTKTQDKIKKLFYQKKYLEGKIEKQIELIEEYKKSLIYQAVTGKIPSLI